MREVDNEHQLDDYEPEAADHAEHHPRARERPLRDEERADDTANHEQVFDAPESGGE